MGEPSIPIFQWLKLQVISLRYFCISLNSIIGVCTKILLHHVFTDFHFFSKSEEELKNKRFRHVIASFYLFLPKIQHVAQIINFVVDVAP